MNDQPPVDRTILLPILIGAFSIFGILIILLIGRASASRATLSEEPTETPFKYIFLGTEPLPSAEGTVTEEGAVATEPVFFEETSTPLQILPSTATLRTAVTLAATATRGTLIATPSPTGGDSGGPPGSGDNNGPPGSGSSPTSSLSTIYDDTNSRLTYSGAWIPQTSVADAYQGTLHRSDVVIAEHENSVTFSFFGQKLQVFYQGGQSLGTMTVTIDGLGFPPISQSLPSTQITYWEPDELLTLSNHTVVITHSGGGSINIDSIAIPATFTATPTSTPTRTPSPTGTQ